MCIDTLLLHPVLFFWCKNSILYFNWTFKRLGKPSAKKKKSCFSGVSIGPCNEPTTRTSCHRVPKPILFSAETVTGWNIALVTPLLKSVFTHKIRSLDLSHFMWIILHFIAYFEYFFLYRVVNVCHKLAATTNRYNLSQIYMASAYYYSVSPIIAQWLARILLSTVSCSRGRPFSFTSPEKKYTSKQELGANFHALAVGLAGRPGSCKPLDSFFTPSDWTRHDCTARVHQKMVNSCRRAGRERPFCFGPGEKSTAVVESRQLLGLQASQVFRLAVGLATLTMLTSRYLFIWLIVQVTWGWSLLDLDTYRNSIQVQQADTWDMHV